MIWNILHLNEYDDDNNYLHIGLHLFFIHQSPYEFALYLLLWFFGKFETTIDHSILLPIYVYKNMYNLGNKTISLWFTYMKKKTDLYFSTYTLGGRVAQKWLYRENIIQNFFFCTIYLASICVTQTQNQKNFVRHFRRSSMILGPVPVVIISCRIFPIRGSSS